MKSLTERNTFESLITGFVIAYATNAFPRSMSSQRTTSRTYLRNHYLRMLIGA